MSVQNQNEQTLNVDAFLELLGYAMIGVAFTLKQLQDSIIAQQAFGQHAVLSVDCFNPLRAPSANYQQEHERVVARSKQFQELLEHARELRTKSDVEAFLKSRMGNK